MPLALEITLIVVLVVVAIALVPLLVQLLRTTREIDVFLVSLRKDVSQIAEDVHASRLRMDHLAATVQSSLSDFALFSKSVGELGGSLKDLHDRFRNSLELTSRTFGGVLGGLSSVLAFFKPTHPSQTPE